MKLPTEQQIEATISEMESTANHEGSEDHHCEMCDFSKGLSQRGGEEPTAIDRLVMDLIHNSPALMLSATMGGFSDMIRLGRICMFIGLKVGRNQEAVENLANEFEV